MALTEGDFYDKQMTSSLKASKRGEPKKNEHHVTYTIGLTHASRTSVFIVRKRRAYFKGRIAELLYNIREGSIAKTRVVSSLAGRN
ncbi:hypothetical protein H5410_004055 [Solanum commersonii]|uniref:Uncharacterized protein n=1 Tax=Solanum commersonii TaxID=4109 RepID=A0A9J6B6V8_SOLCO|nr:hypothetical protein H5410_004055 [Solanum commersonii]